MDQRHLPVFATKLYVPLYRDEFVPRAALVDRLLEGLDRKATLICAPAGYGKTTLVSELAHRLTSADSADSAGLAWFSLDSEDHDGERFLSHLLAAIRGALNLSDEETSVPRTADAVIDLIIREMVPREEGLVIVLDDYHLVDSPVVDEIVQLLLTHLPRQVHLIIVTRADPSLPLARLRVNGELSEIRAADLRFTQTEAAYFLNRTMELHLSHEQVLSLEKRTEGWVAALNLAALALRKSQDAEAKIESISGTNRHVADYLIEEVLSRQSPEVREFLLQTSILDRMTAPLCDALTGRSDGQEILEELHRGNVFTAALDDDGVWYRYHRLFSDLLRTRLALGGEDRVRQLHRAASLWHEGQGFVREAIEHSVEAGDRPRVAVLVERAIDDVFMQGGDSKSILRWLDDVPPELISRSSRLAIAYSWGLYYAGRGDEIEDVLEPVAVPDDRTEGGRFLAESKQIRAVLAAARGDLELSGSLYQESHDLAPSTDPSARGMASQGIALGLMASGDLTGARSLFVQAVDLLDKAEEYGISLVSRTYLGYLHAEHGDLKGGVAAFQATVEEATRRGLAHTPIIGVTFSGLADLRSEQGDDEESAENARRAEERSRGQNPLQTWFAMMLLAFLEALRGEFDAALRRVDRVIAVARVESLQAIAFTARMWRIRILVMMDSARGEERHRLEIERWLEFINGEDWREPTRGLVQLPGYGFDAVALVAARALLYLREPEPALRILETVVGPAREAGRLRSHLEGLVLRARALQFLGDHETALSTLTAAMELAEPQGFSRLFLAEGPEIARLIYEVAGRSPSGAYARRLLYAYPDEVASHSAGSEDSAANEGLFEPLSDRELDVLSLISEGLNNSQIGESLFISAQTVKTHTRNLYAKLDAHSRTEAVHKARAFGLIPHT